MQLAALCYGPGLPPTGARLMLRLDSFQLGLTLPDGRVRSVPLAQVQMAAGGFNDSVWRLEWSEGAERWAALIDDPVVQQQLRAQPPSGLTTQLAGLLGSQRRSRTLRGLGYSGLALWFLLPLLLLGLLLWNANALVGRLAGLVSVEQEQKLGEQVWRAQKTQLRLIENTEANRAVETIGGRIAQGSAYRYRWFVARDNSINAFAMPGGVVVVHTGLIRAAKTPEELAGVLAHEVQHVEQRHSLKAMGQSLGVTAALGLLLGDVSGIAQIAAGLSQLSYSRDAEREADDEGLKALRRAGIDPQGMVGMFQTLAKESEGALAPPAFLSSHPATRERVERMQAAIAAAGPAPVTPLEIEWAAVQASVE